MFEFLFCSSLTILPDYLFRRYVQGKRLGKEITIYSVWFELRYGIVTCALLTISLITMIFYFHPSTSNATLSFRTVPVLPEMRGRVEEVYVDVSVNAPIKAGEPIFRLDTSQDEASAASARQQIAEVDAEVALAQGELAVAKGQVGQAQANLQNAKDELETKQELFDRNSGAVPVREIERLRNTLESARWALESARAQEQVARTKIEASLPARRATAQARLDEILTTIERKTTYAGVDGTIQQFTLRVGDVVNPAMRPGGILVPADAGHRMIAGFGQIEAQVIKEGMIGEVACAALPFTIIPVVVTEVQNVLASGQISGGERLLDAAQNNRPGSITTAMEPLYPGGFDRLKPGSRCVANLYTNNHERLHGDEPIGFGEYIFLHVVDTVGLVHAFLLRSQAIQLPIKTLVLSGHH